eukprot:6185289-Pleurochrysis_carterae.AAC.1
MPLASLRATQTAIVCSILGGTGGHCVSGQCVSGPSCDKKCTGLDGIDYSSITGISDSRAIKTAETPHVTVKHFRLMLLLSDKHIGSSNRHTSKNSAKSGTQASCALHHVCIIAHYRAHAAQREQ